MNNTVKTPLETRFNIKDYKQTFTNEDAAYNKNQLKQKIKKEAWQTLKYQGGHILFLALVFCVSYVLINFLVIGMTPKTLNSVVAFSVFFAMLVSVVCMIMLVWAIGEAIIAANRVKKQYAQNKTPINYETFRSDFLQQVDTFYDAEQLSDNTISSFLKEPDAPLDITYSYASQENSNEHVTKIFAISRSEDGEQLICKLKKIITQNTQTFN